MRTFFLIVVSALFLSACSSIDLIETRSQEVERTKLELPAASPLELDRPNWIVVTPDNADEIFAYLEQEGYDTVIFGLTDRGYEKLSIDFTKIRQHINTQRNVLIQYKDYYEDDSSPPESSE